MNRYFLVTLYVTLFLFGGAFAQSPDSIVAQADSAQVDSTAKQVDAVALSYVQKCVGCHTIGGGKLTGPDLLPTRAWPKSELAAKVKLMESRVGPLSQQDVDQYVELLQDARAQERVSIAQELASKAVAATLDPASEQIGRKLFEGSTRLANGGIACITCHRAGAQGGSFGPDLTALQTRMGKVAMTSAIQQSQFLVMSGTYKNRPITAQEAVHLAEYLSSPDMMPQTSMEDRAPMLGTVIGVLGLLTVVGLYRKRSRNRISRQRGIA